MSEPVSDPLYWQRRLTQARSLGQLHRALYDCTPQRWAKIEEKHRKILRRTVKPFDSVLDAGCGYGRLVDLLPTADYEYVGVDICPELIQLAGELHPERRWDFQVADIRDLSAVLDERRGRRFNWAILISIRPMIRRNLGDWVWVEMEKELRRVAKRLLFLEYDPFDEGREE